MARSGANTISDDSAVLSMPASVHEAGDEPTARRVTPSPQNGTDNSAQAPKGKRDNQSRFRHDDGRLPFQTKPDFGELKMDASKASDVLSGLSVLISVVG